MTQVYDWNSEQATVFETTARPIVDACMDGYNGAQQPAQPPQCQQEQLQQQQQPQLPPVVPRLDLVGTLQAARKVSLPPCKLSAFHHIACRHYLCIWTDWHRQIVHHGGQGRASRPPWHHPQCL
jgi:hypothetical protein